MLFREGDPGDAMYVVLDGRVRISKHIPGAGEEALAILERGDYFGEMALIDQMPRSAEAKAHERGAVVLSIPQMVVGQLLDRHKLSSVRLLRILCGLVAQRLREIDDKLITWYILVRRRRPGSPLGRLFPGDALCEKLARRAGERERRGFGPARPARRDALGERVGSPLRRTRLDLERPESNPVPDSRARAAELPVASVARGESALGSARARRLDGRQLPQPGQQSLVLAAANEQQRARVVRDHAAIWRTRSAAGRARVFG